MPVIIWFVRYGSLRDFRLLLRCNEIFIVVGYCALHVGSALLKLQGNLDSGNVGSVLLKLQGNLDSGNQLPVYDVLNPGRVKISIRHSFSNFVILLKHLTKKLGNDAHLL